MSPQGKQFGNGLWLSFLWHSFMIPDKILYFIRFIYLYFIYQDYRELLNVLANAWLNANIILKIFIYNVMYDS